jgi:hypothetical protein
MGWDYPSPDFFQQIAEAVETALRERGWMDEYESETAAAMNYGDGAQAEADRIMAAVKAEMVDVDMDDIGLELRSRRCSAHHRGRDTMSDKPRILMTFQPLPERATPSEAIAYMDADIREAMLKVQERLRNQAMALHVTGWQEDDEAEYAITQRTVIGRLRITRGKNA